MVEKLQLQGSRRCDGFSPFTHPYRDLEIETDSRDRRGHPESIGFVFGEFDEFD